MNNPTPELIKQTRKEAKLTQTKAATLIHKKLRAWAQYEAGDRKMDPAYWELFLIKIAKDGVVK
jgi:transcriptional regulator with XRE-family HTH domain